ncbi:hypothetical protein Bca52824_050187 [Brassica carinata]|uniref:Uncharacterized protein n=1 Tax=Brassica carinata TaxID=52824 RepID=A0A8X7RP18_BRACI|nr:hypothetical protein Bca52824_050187 [Brassica carinata]
MSERSANVIVKESSQVNTSSRIYYYDRASVPFLWETRPGTPKHFSESFRIPPLTPPPSYYSSGNKLSKARTKQTRSVKTLFNAKHQVSRPSFSWSSTTSSSSSSSTSFPSLSPRSKTAQRANKCYLSCSRSYVKDEDEEEIGSSSPTSTLCYKRGFRSSIGSVKRALSSVLSHRSSRNDLRLI